MSSLSSIAAPAHFLTGLALFTLASMACSTLVRSLGRRNAGWGISALVALGMADWCEISDGDVSSPIVCQSIRLVLEMVALVGLVELGRLCTSGLRRGLLPRWSYPLVAGVATAAVLSGSLNPLELALRLAICWQAGWLAASYLSRGQHSAAEPASATTIAAIGPQTLAARAIIGGLLVYLVAVAVAITVAGMVAALVSVAAAYLAFGPSPSESRQAKLRWRTAWPVGFLLIATAGCFSLPAAGVTENDVLLVELLEPADSDLAGADASSPETGDACGDEISAAGDRFADHQDAARESEVVRQAKRIGLGVSPIILFVLLVWGLSRLPFVH